MTYFDPTLVRKGEEDDAVSVVTKSLEDLQKAVDERLKAVETKSAPDFSKIEDRLAKIEAKANRPQGKADEEPSVERKAFGFYISRGDGLPDEHKKALTVSSDPGAGILAPIEMSTEFIRDLVEFSPIRSVASVRSTVATSVRYPRRTSITNAQWEGELEESQESTVSFGTLEIPVHKMTTHVDLSNELLADSGGEAEKEVRLALAEDYGKKEASGYVNGSGVKMVFSG